MSISWSICVNQNWTKAKILDIAEKDSPTYLLKENKTWSSVSNSSLVRPWFQSKTNLHFKKIFGPEIFGPKTNINSKKNLLQTSFGSINLKFWKTFSLEFFLVLPKFGSIEILGPKEFLGMKKIFGSIKFWGIWKKF